MKTPFEQATLEILQMAHDQHARFALQIGFMFDTPIKNHAFETGMNEELWRLYDISPVSAAPTGVVFRIFILTDKGRAKLAELEGKIQ